MCEHTSEVPLHIEMAADTMTIFRAYGSQLQESLSQHQDYTVPPSAVPNLQPLAKACSAGKSAGGRGRMPLVDSFLPSLPSFPSFLPFLPSFPSFLPFLPSLPSFPSFLPFLTSNVYVSVGCGRESISTQVRYVSNLGGSCGGWIRDKTSLAAG